MVKTVRWSQHVHECKNYSKQGTGQRLHDTAPLGATESHPPTPPPPPLPPLYAVREENKPKGQRERETTKYPE